MNPFSAALVAILVAGLVAAPAGAAETPRWAAAPAGQAAEAAGPAASLSPWQPEPALAGGLAIGGPIALAAGASLMNASGIVVGSPALNLLHYGMMFGAPAAFGLGHVYAGDPRRGALVGLGGLAATYGAIGAGAGVLGLATVLDGPAGPPLGPPWAWTAGITIALAGISGYGVWAAADAARTAALAGEAAE